MSTFPTTVSPPGTDPASMTPTDLATYISTQVMTQINTFFDANSPADPAFGTGVPQPLIPAIPTQVNLDPATDLTGLGLDSHVGVIQGILAAAGNDGDHSADWRTLATVGPLLKLSPGSPQAGNLTLDTGHIASAGVIESTIADDLTPGLTITGNPGLTVPGLSTELLDGAFSTAVWGTNVDTDGNDGSLRHLPLGDNGMWHHTTLAADDIEAQTFDDLDSDSHVGNTLNRIRAQLGDRSTSHGLSGAWDDQPDSSVSRLVVNGAPLPAGDAEVYIGTGLASTQNNDGSVVITATGVGPVAGDPIGPMLTQGFVVSGFGATTTGGLDITIATGTAYIPNATNAWATMASGVTLTLDDNSDSWIYWKGTGATSGDFDVTTVGNGASKPSTPGGTILLWKAASVAGVCTLTDERIHTIGYGASSLSLTPGVTQGPLAISQGLGEISVDSWGDIYGYGANGSRLIADSDSSQWSSLSAAVAAIGSTVHTLQVSQTETLSGDLTVPVTMTLKMARGGKIATNGHVLTINGFLVGAERRQIFDVSGGGSVVPAKGSVQRLNAEWWGADATNTIDSASAFQSAITAGCNIGATLNIYPGTYKIASTVNIQPSTVAFHSLNIEARTGALLSWTGGADGSVFLSRNWKNSHVKGVNITTGNSDRVVGWDVDCDSTWTSTSLVTWEDCTVQIGTGAGCQGWRGSYSWILNGRSGQSDLSFLNCINCFVIGVSGGTGNQSGTAWQMCGPNNLNCQWFGGGAVFVGQVFENGQGQGGGSMAFYGLGDSHTGVAQAIIDSSAVGVDVTTLDTQVASGSNGVDVSTYTGTQSLHVQSTSNPSTPTANYPASGLLRVPISGGRFTTIQYGSKSATTFDNCTRLGNLSGTLTTGAAIGWSLTAARSTDGYMGAGTVTITTSTGLATIAYTQISRRQFLGCTLATGTGTVMNATTVAAGDNGHTLTTLVSNASLNIASTAGYTTTGGFVTLAASGGPAVLAYTSIIDATHLAISAIISGTGSWTVSTGGAVNTNITGFPYVPGKFSFQTAGTYLIDGGRFEVGQQFLQVGGSGGTGSTLVTCKGLEITAHTGLNGVLVNAGTLANISFEGCRIGVGAGTATTAKTFTLGGGTGSGGSLSIRNCEIFSSDPCFTVTSPTIAPWRVEIASCKTIANTGQVTGFFNGGFFGYRPAVSTSGLRNYGAGPFDGIKTGAFASKNVDGTTNTNGTTLAVNSTSQSGNHFESQTLGVSEHILAASGDAYHAGRMKAGVGALLTPQSFVGTPPLFYAAALADTPVQMYKLDEASGATMTDSSGNSATGAYVGASVAYHQSIVPAVTGFTATTGVILPGSSSGYMTAPSTGLPADHAAFTVEMLIRPEAMPGGNTQQIIAHNFSTISQDVYLANSGSGQVLGYSNNAETTPSFTLNGAAYVLSLGTTYHVVLVWDGTQYLTATVNGVKLDAQDMAPFTKPTWHSTATIGQEFGRNNGNAAYWATAGYGFIGIYASALSDARIAVHYAAVVGAPHAQGEMYVDSAGSLFLCTAAGFPATWLDITAGGSYTLPDATTATTGGVRLRTAAGGAHPVALTTDDFGVAATWTGKQTFGDGTNDVAYLRMFPASSRSGPPTGAAHALGDICPDVNGIMYFCTTAGTPGSFAALVMEQSDGSVLGYGS